MFLSVFAVNAQSIDYLGKARKYYSEGNCEGAKTYLNLYVELGGTVDKVVRDFSAEVDKCLKDKDKGSSENVVCTYSVKTVIMPSTTTYDESASGVAQGDHEYVDLGLSVKWATCNVGATTPEGYGDFFAWGETSTKTEYTEDNSKTSGNSMGDISGNSSYDAATANWGGNWRIPTEAEMKELIDRCNWKWTTQNGVKGYKVIGPNGNSIFLPAAGYHWSSLGVVGDGNIGHYWSSTPARSSVYRAYDLSFNREAYFVYDSDDREDGRSVRPVLE